MILNGAEITERALKGMIDPFVPGKVRKEQSDIPGTKQHIERHVLSYGLGGFGYDLRLSPKDFLLNQAYAHPLDPKALLGQQDHFVELKPDLHGRFLIPPRTFALGRAVELLTLPDDLLCTGTGKSTYLRAGVEVCMTPLEPGWRGVPTLHIHNHALVPVFVYANEGIAQILFLRGNPTTTYTGAYQNATTTLLAAVTGMVEPVGANVGSGDQQMAKALLEKLSAQEVEYLKRAGWNPPMDV